jgi:hypothetical protein
MKSYEEYYKEIMDSLFNHKGNSVWRVVFIVLLIVNVVFFYLVGTAMTSSPGLGLAAIGVFIFAFPLVLIDFIAVITYIIKKRPQGIFKTITYTVFAVISWILLHVGIAIINIYFF